LTIGEVWIGNCIYRSLTSLADSHTTNHTTRNLLSVLPLVFTIRFLATDLSQSYCKFKHHCNYSVKSSTHTLSLLRIVCFLSCYLLRLLTPWIPIYKNSAALSLLIQLFTTHCSAHFTFFRLDTPLELFWLPNELSVNVKVKVTLRLAVYRQSVLLASSPLRPTTRFFFRLNSCGNSPYVASSLTRRWICLS
jgi:hypothetical protein